MEGGGGEELRERAQGSRVLRIMDIACEALAHAGIALISAFMVLQIIEIVGRKTIGISIVGLSEIAQALIMGCICLAWPLVFSRDGHIAVEFVTDPLPPRPLALLKAVVGLVGAIFVGTLTYYSFVQAQVQVAKGDISPTLHIPILWYWIPLLLGMTASGVACVALTVRHALTAVLGSASRSASSVSSGT